MTSRTTLQEFEEALRNYWLADARDRKVATDLLRYLRNPLTRIPEPEFRQHLAEAILDRRYSAKEYDRLVDAGFDTRDEVAADLADLWRAMYGDEVVSMPAVR